MNKINLTIILNFLFSICIIAQSDQVSLSTGYTQQSYYSMQNGEVLNVPNNNWDIAFSTDAFSSTIRINDGKGAQLFTYPLGDTSAWNAINTNTTNILINPMYNSDTSWSIGAFDLNQTGGFDYGWGVYNLQSHHIIGDSLFMIKTIDGNWKKFWMKRKASGEYQFKYADLDGSDLIDQNILASNYSDKRFIYYSLEQDLVIDREPILSDWDITFTKYITAVQGTPYSVTGALSNTGIQVAEADNILSPLNYTDYTNHNFEQEINTIGYDWKNFQGSYVIDPNRCYFILDYNQNIWRLVFTSFQGSSTGDIEFNKQLLTTTSIKNLGAENLLKIYPNPARHNEDITLVYNINSENATITICDLQGKTIYTTNLIANSLKTHTISYNHLDKGTYIISLDLDGKILTEKLIIR